MPPTSVMWPGQDMATPCAVPPKCDGTCFTHLKGVSIAHAQPAAKCGNVRSDPQNSYQSNWSLTGTATPLKVVNILPGMNAGASTYEVPSPIKGSGTAWVLLGSWALSPARPTPIHPRHECRGLSALFGELVRCAVEH